jgi:hypothetical protein
MTALDRLVHRAFGRPIRRPSAAQLAIPGLAAVLGVVLGAALVLQPSPGPGQDGGPASGVGAVRSFGAPSQVADAGFWDLLYAFEGTGPAYRSLADLGKTSEAVVVGSFTGEVEPGREPCDEGSLANGVPRAQACVFFANLPFRIDEVLAGSLPEQYRTTVKIEYMVRPSRQEVLPEVVPTDERIVLFIGSKYLRQFGIQDVYYEVGVGRGTFREVDGRVVPVNWPADLPDDPQFGRLEGMPFERFVELVRRVRILDLMPQG